MRRAVEAPDRAAAPPSGEPPPRAAGGPAGAGTVGPQAAVPGTGRPGRPGRSGPVGRGGGGWRQRATVVAFLAPALLLYVLLTLVPIAQGAFYSTWDWNGLEPLETFVGLQNYRDALADPVFLGALRHVAVIAVLSLALQLPFALGLAVLLNQRIRGRAVFRLLFFLPFVLGDVAVAIVWKLLLQPAGLADEALGLVGLDGLTQLWLADQNVVLYTVFVVVSWKYFGFHMVLCLAGLQGIPTELEEAAALDGATRAQTFRYVTLPLLGPTLRISVFLSIIGSLQLFDLVWVLTGGGPVGASHTTSTYMLQYGFDRKQLGYGSAVAVVGFVVSFVVALSYQRFVLRRDVEGALTALGT